MLDFPQPDLRFLLIHTADNPTTSRTPQSDNKICIAMAIFFLSLLTNSLCPFRPM